MSSKRAIYQAVFPTATETSAPTPTATPLADVGSFDTHGIHSQDHDPEDVAAQRIQWQRAWHTATSYLSLPRAGISLKEATQRGDAVQRSWMQPCSTTVSEAIAFLVRNAASSNAPGSQDDSAGLMDWYAQEVTGHFVEFQLASLIKILDESIGGQALPMAMHLLRTTQAVYFYRLEHAILPHVKPKAQKTFKRFRETHHALVANSLATSKLSNHLATFLHAQSSRLFDASAGEDRTESEEVIEKLGSILHALEEVGLGGDQVQRLLAEIVDDGLTTYVANEYSALGSKCQSNSDNLSTWIDERLVPLMTNAVESLSASDRSIGASWEQQLSNEVSSWKERAMHELAALRLEEAFDIVLRWQNSLPAGLADVAPFTKSTAGRAFIINKFNMAVGQRLLHPGASTIEILQVYVHIIMAFLEMDPKGVLLDRISRPLRRYLRERPDTVKTIIEGLLRNPQVESEDSEPINDLAKVLNELQEDQDPEHEIEGELFDINWEPDPVDAAPEFKADERGEIIASLIDIFDNKDVFVKEFQNMLSDRLLQNEHELSREVQVLELFKKRIGEAHLQACEVMLKDVSDSRRIDTSMRRDEKLTVEESSRFKTKILSRFYWPSLQPEDFQIPADIHTLQEKFAAGFEHYKTSRKLTWLNSLGRAKVELQLKDRVIEEEVHTWQASVIHAFAESTSGDHPPVCKTAERVTEELQMDEDLVQAALTFWVGKMVLRQDGAAYTVLEELPFGIDEAESPGHPGGEALAAHAAVASASAAAADVGAVRRSEEEIAEERMAVFWQFIQSMLRNQGHMPLPRIVMMLKFAVQGGFPYSNDELKAFLARKIEAGQLELVGGNYKMASGAS